MLDSWVITFENREERQSVTHPFSFFIERLLERVTAVQGSVVGFRDADASRIGNRTRLRLVLIGRRYEPVETLTASGVLSRSGLDPLPVYAAGRFCRPVPAEHASASGGAPASSPVLEPQHYTDASTVSDPQLGQLGGHFHLRSNKWRNQLQRRLQWLQRRLEWWFQWWFQRRPELWRGLQLRRRPELWWGRLQL